MNNQEVPTEEISMEDVLGKPLTPEQKRKKAEDIQFDNEKVLFRGVERKRRDFCCDATGEVSYDDLSYNGFTEDESRRASGLAQPFNEKFYDENDDNSESMFAKWMDKDGFIFAITDDLTGSIIETVWEKDLPQFLADRLK